MDARREASLLRARVEELGTPERAAGAKAYMRSALDFTGTTVPDVRRVATAWLRGHTDLSSRDLRAVTEALWRTDTFELRLLATVLLQHRSETLDTADLPWLERLLRDCRAWALMDNLAPYAVAAVLDRSRALRRRTLLRWSCDPEFWMRRAALLTMHRALAVGEGDWDLWTTVARRQLEDQDRWQRIPPAPEERFFIRKALGWALRDAARSRPDEVAAFVRLHEAKLAGLTLREATRGLQRAASTRKSMAPQAKARVRAGSGGGPK